MTLNLEGTTSLEDLLAKVKDTCRPGKTLRMGDWTRLDYNYGSPPVFSTRWDLDKVSPNNPVILGRADGHGAVQTVRRSSSPGSTKNTPNPFGGEVSKDKQSGEPNGMLLDAAQGL